MNGVGAIAPARSRSRHDAIGRVITDFASSVRIPATAEGLVDADQILHDTPFTLRETHLLFDLRPLHVEDVLSG